MALSRDQLIEELASIVAGLQNPYSGDDRILGVASLPFKRVIRDVKLFGYADSAEVEEYLRRVLG